MLRSIEAKPVQPGKYCAAFGLLSSFFTNAAQHLSHLNRFLSMLRSI
jgi:hypothetical protein